MNEDNVRSRLQPGFEICEIVDTPVERDIDRIFPSHLHVEGSSAVFRGFKHCHFNSCLWIPLLLSAWLNSGSIGLVMYLHVLVWPSCSQYFFGLYSRVLKTRDRGRIRGASRPEQFKRRNSCCSQQAIPNRLRPLRLAIFRAPRPPAISLRLLLTGFPRDRSVYVIPRRLIFHPAHVAGPTGNQECSQ
jgi:hypothetical protein